MSTPTAFDLSVAPTEGLTVLEASAGTGKTYSLAGLTVLGLATGRVTTREVLVVTFTEAATAELSGRLRRRLAEAVDLLERATSDPTVVSDDTVDRILLEADPDELAVRCGRLVAALAEFDAMSVSTIHGFCQRLLAAAGATAVSVTGDDSDIDEVVIDRILAAGVELAKPDRVVTAVKRRLALPDAEMGRHPAAAAELRNDLDGLIDLVDGAVDEVRVRRARWRRRTFDSMLSETRDLLGHPLHGPGMVAELRERFRLVLIDEFQDTDRVQWDIFRTAFLDGSPDGAGSGARRSAVVVVGDPKQSIYRFRGAELSAYLEAVGYAVATGGSLHTLGTNFRSDAALLTALEHILTGATFGDPSVAFQPVAAGRSDTKRLIDPDGATAALRWRLAHPPADAKGAVAAPDGHRYVKADLVAQVVHHLTTVRIVRTNGTEEALRPSDIGILVRANSYAEEVAEMLRVAGVPVTTSGSDSVLDSVAAQHWDTLIASLQRPSSPSDARAVAVGAFGHLDAQAVADLTERDEAALLERQRDLVGALSRGGVPRLMVELRRNGHQRRILAHLGGERLLTDLEHIAEILQRATDGRPTSAARLAAVIAELRSADDDSVSSDLLDRRLDRDDETVKIMTIHKAKGLEFPVVFCPALWPIPSGGRSEIPHAHVPGEGRRFSTYWLTGGTSKAKGVTDVAKLAGGEQDGEQRRQLYVALTRAVHRLVVWDVPGFSRSKQPLRSLLRDTGCSDLDAVADASNGTIDVTAVTSLAAAAHLDIDTTRPADLEVAAFERDLASAWRVWSFTAIERSVADGDDAHRPIEPLPAPAGGLDEPSAEATGSTPVENAPVTLRTVPGSAAFGSLVHGVLETVDFASSTLDDDLEAACDDALRHRAMGVGADVLAAGLADALRAPLGGPLGGRRLVDLTSGDRLDELEFHLPLAAFSALDLAAVVAAGLADDDPMRPWFAAAADGALDVDVAGMLTGSIDLVARIDGRYLVADYKTNRIGPDATFTDREMVAEMHRHAYPLQAVLYLVALRRYLRFRTGASTADDLARVDASILGAAYLFVRGMDPGRSAADACGVVWWTPPTTVIADLDELFSTGGTR
jgi:exodeoxyribonuclease V beta subunit